MSLIQYRYYSKHCKHLVSPGQIVNLNILCRIEDAPNTYLKKFVILLERLQVHDGVVGQHKLQLHLGLLPHTGVVHFLFLFIFLFLDSSGRLPHSIIFTLYWIKSALLSAYRIMENILSDMVPAFHFFFFFFSSSFCFIE